MKKKSEKIANTDDDVKKDDKDQSQRFVETAKELGLKNTTIKSFEQKFEKLKPDKPSSK